MNTPYNPYQPPQTNVAMPPIPGQVDGLLTVPRRVSLGAPFAWLGEGWRLFKRDMGMWLLIELVFVVLLVAAMLVGFFSAGLPETVGTIISAVFEIILNALMTMMAAGLVMGIHKSYRGGSLDVGDLFAAFKTHFVPLALIGLVGGVLSYGLTELMALLWQAPAIPSAVSLEEQTFVFEGFFAGQNLLLMSVYFLLSMFISFLTWYAAPMVAMHNVPVLTAIKLSFQGLLKNILPFLFYNLLSLLLLVLGFVAFLFGLVVVVPWLTCSTYISYRNIFLQ